LLIGLVVVTRVEFSGRNHLASKADAKHKALPTASR
jgi:hypothetical protein